MVLWCHSAVKINGTYSFTKRMGDRAGRFLEDYVAYLQELQRGFAESG